MTWITVTERLPEERIRVIAAQPGYVLGDCFYGDSLRDSLGKCWRYSHRMEEPVQDHLQPTHWQPLPDAPASGVAVGGNDQQEGRDG